jgi:hypothetical protein
MAAAMVVMAAACLALSAPPAQAASLAAGSGASSGRLPSSPPLATALPQPRVAELAPWPDLPADGMAAREEMRPKNGTTGLFMEGMVHGSWGPTGIEITVGDVANKRGSGTSGTLRLRLWATTTAPVFGSSISFYALGPA